MKNFIITANWKLYGNNILIKNFIKQLKYFFYQNIIKNTIIFAPPVVYINSIKNKIKNSNFFIGAQNVDIHDIGAFTGEISVNMLDDIGVNYIIIGHSERRLLHHENNRYIAKKFRIIQEKNLVPILCIGENLTEKNMKKSESVCKKQIDVIFTTVGKDAFKNSIIAYEPVWAIGTGKTADISYVNKIHKFIKNYISDTSDTKRKNIVIQYGGSVNENNIKNFLNTEYVDGVLLGATSLKFEKFIQVIKIVNKI